LVAFLAARNNLDDHKIRIFWTTWLDRLQLEQVDVSMKGSTKIQSFGASAPCLDGRT
jgi:hypothetical protein